MRSITRLVILSGCIPLLAGCPEDGGSGQASPPSPKKPSAEAQRSAVLERELQGERDKVQALTKAIQERERKLVERDASINRWQEASFALAGGCFLGVFAGAALGSRARHDGQAR